MYKKLSQFKLLCALIFAKVFKAIRWTGLNVGLNQLYNEENRENKITENNYNVKLVVSICV